MGLIGLVGFLRFRILKRFQDLDLFSVVLDAKFFKEPVILFNKNCQTKCNQEIGFFLWDF